MQKRRHGLTLGRFMGLLALLIAVALLFVFLRSASRPTSAAKGESLFPLVLSAKDVDGKTFSTADRRGRVVLVNVFATWCHGCVTETPHLVKLYEQRQADGLDMVMVSYEEIGLVKVFRQQHKIPFPVIAGDESVMKAIPGFRGFPTTVMIDREGNVRRLIVGADLVKIQKSVNELLAE
jgi:thiol-disulfide isomerase/thioredoxin